MKNTLPIVLSAVVLSAFSCMPDASARRLSADEALQRVSSSMMKKGNVSGAQTQLVYTETTPESHATALYVFNNVNGGFMVLSADDELMPMLAYSDNNAFDAGNIPPAMKYWLGEYARQIEYFYAYPESGARSSSPKKVAGKAITPLLTTQWNQGSPYNNLCPAIGGERTVTGCVATAMAQVMKYHNYPSQGSGYNSYNWTAGNQTLSYDFSKVTFDWDNMVNKYDGVTTTAAQNEAVANLMYACGMSVNMNYDISANGGSGAASFNIPRGLINNFGYKNTTTYVDRDSYSAMSNWEDLIYNELLEGRPVLYGGRTNKNEGHQFVCDGYDGAGKYHFNWGWGGLSDGYFTLDALDPPAMGAGGAASGFGFNYDQSVVVGVMTPSTDSKVYDPILYSSGSLGLNVSTSNIKVTLGGSDWYNAFFGLSSIDLYVKLGVKLVSHSDNSEIYYFNTSSNIMQACSAEGDLHGIGGYSVSYKPSEITPGTYTIYPVFKYEDEIFPFYPYDGATVAKADYTFDGEISEGNASLEMVEFSTQGDILPYEDHTFRFVVKNTGNIDYDDNLYIYYFDATKCVGGIYFKVNIPAGTQKSYNLTLPNQFETTGYYEYLVVDETDNELGSYNFFVGKKVTNVKMEKNTHSVSVADGPFTLNVALEPEDAHMKTLEWTSSDEDVATVDANGLVTPKGDGKTEIRAATTDSSALHDVCLLSVGNSVIVYEIVNESELLYDVYTVDGVKVGEKMDGIRRSQLAPGIYLFVRDGHCTKRIVRP